MKEQIPTIEEIFRHFEQKAMNPAITEDELAINLAMFFQVARYEKRPFHMHFQRLHRARGKFKNSIEEACEEFGHVDRLKYAPIGTDVPASRCNRRGKPTFYCSNDNGVTIFEIKAMEGQYVVLATFKHKSRSTITLDLPIIGMEEIYQSLSKRDRNDSMAEILASAIKSTRTSDLRTLILDRRLSKWFTKKVDETNTHIYKLTNSYYEMFLKHMGFNGNKIEAIIYPSVASLQTGYNIVIEPDFYERNMVVESATIYKLEEKTGDRHVLRPLKIIDLIKSDGSIIWKDTDDTRAWILEPDTPTYFYKGVV